MGVSIRSRLFGREKLDAGFAPGYRLDCFNPLPAFWPGETWLLLRPASLRWCFNPLPAFWPGETSHAITLRMIHHVSIRSRLFGREKPGWRPRPSCRCPCFNPLPAFWPGETVPCSSIITASITVSIRSRLFGREKRAHGRDPGRQRSVSIRSRLFGREKPAAETLARINEQFQSAPGFLAGRNPCVSDFPKEHDVFQSAPGFLAGRNPGRSFAAPVPGWFQSAPGFLAGRNATACSSSTLGEVSIRSRLFGREKQIWLSSTPPAPMFQSAPGFLAGRNGWRQGRNSSTGGFNPLPAFWPGETGHRLAVAGDVAVSIRSRLFGREKPYGWCAPCSRGRFQSAPGFLAGRNGRSGALAVRNAVWFQSAPGFLAGRNFTASPALPVSTEFQSAPGFLAGRNSAAAAALALSATFQSAPGFLAGRNAVRAPCNLILTTSFNPLPAFWPGETRWF